MNTPADAVIGMNYRYQPKEPGRRVKGLLLVIALHAFLGYALVSGMARKGLNLVKKPLEAVVIQEVIIPPPPPPPPPPPKKLEMPKEVVKSEAPPPPPYIPPPEVATPTVSAGISIAATTSLPTAPVVVAPPAPPAPPAPAKPAANRSDIGVACPTQVPPEMPRKAIQEGTEGVVKAQIRIKGGEIQEVTIISGPRVFHTAVKEAMKHYKCISDAGGEVIATQEFNFRLE